MPTVSYRTTRSADSNTPTVPLIARTISEFRHFVDDLVESGKYLQK